MGAAPSLGLPHSRASQSWYHRPHCTGNYCMHHTVDRFPPHIPSKKQHMYSVTQAREHTSRALHTVLFSAEVAPQFSVSHSIHSAHLQLNSVLAAFFLGERIRLIDLVATLVSSAFTYRALFHPRHPHASRTPSHLAHPRTPSRTLAHPRTPSLTPTPLTPLTFLCSHLAL